MDVVPPRTASEATADSVSLPGEIAVKDKILTVENEVGCHSVVEN
jgi:hypothetical protein